MHEITKNTWQLILCKVKKWNIVKLEDLCKRVISSSPVLRFVAASLAGDAVVRLILTTAEVAISSTLHLLIVGEIATAVIITSVLWKRGKDALRFRRPRSRGEELIEDGNKLAQHVQADQADWEVMANVRRWLQAVRIYLVMSGDYEWCQRMQKLEEIVPRGSGKNSLRRSR